MPQLICRSRFSRGRLSRLVPGAGLLMLWLSAPGSWAQAPDSIPLADRVLTNIYDIWEIPREERIAPHRMRTEVVLYYFDPEWNLAWGECLGRPAFLPVFDCPTPLKVGQRLSIDGIIVPVRERFDWSRTRVQVLEEGVEVKAPLIRNPAQRAQHLKAHLVRVEGLVDRLMEDLTHVTVNLVMGDGTATVYVLKSRPGVSPEFKVGDFIRLKGALAPEFDRNGDLRVLAFWVARSEDVEMIGSLATDPRFSSPVVSSDMIRDDSPTNVLLHLAGVVREHEPGKWVTLWDAAGQVSVQSRQTQPLRFGERIEAIGSPLTLGVQQCLLGGLYRVIHPTNTALNASAASTGPLRLAEQIRDLNRAEALSRRPVRLRAVVTWFHPETPFVYVQDASSGVRVMNPRWQSEDASRPGTIVTVEGEVAEGDFVPVVTNAVLSRIGWWALEGGRPVTLEQALTGLEDGNWVEMSGFVREVVRSNGLARLTMTTSSGDFQTWTPAVQPFESLQGSIVRVRGVCAAIANARHQLTGIQVWAPEAKFLQVEEPAPDDLFAAPLRPLGSLRRFNIQNALNQRVRTAGTVVLHVLGRYLYVQDEADSVFALSQQQERLRPGDRVEVVGFPGIEGRRFLLREAVYRRISTGLEPAPIQLSALHAVNTDWEGLLARAEGRLLNVVEKEGELRLLIHSTDTVFEVILGADLTLLSRMHSLEVGSQLAVTGVYEVQTDEYGKPRSFILRLRSLRDVTLLDRPPWWTLSRLLWVLLGVITVSVLALIWGAFISHKNTLLSQAQTELQMANDQLEHRVQQRTRELQEQVLEKQRAHAELAEAQQTLMLTSRQAGMAEVATGVLHNVGNVLNSVNVSAGLLAERLRFCPIESVAKTAALINERRDDLGRFLTEDPRGKALPGYLEKLADVLSNDKRDLQAEIESLAKNIDHIKIIVAMQQSYARVGGMLEQLEAADLLEDALQINSAGLERHHIRVLRDYQSVPSVLVDRHKVLQILVNLINNAKHALNERETNRQIVLGVHSAGPDRVQIVVTDNGMGIAPENLNRIFSQGFTTRKDGHGFGLHSGANAAKELGGSLSVTSDGLGAGAAFTLELPASSNSMILKPSSEPSPKPA